MEHGQSHAIVDYMLPMFKADFSPHKPTENLASGASLNGLTLSRTSLSHHQLLNCVSWLYAFCGCKAERFFVGQADEKTCCGDEGWNSRYEISGSGA